VGVSSLQGFYLIVIVIGISDHLNIWTDFLAYHEIWFFLFGMNIKSGIGSCIAPKAGLVRHPVKGRAAPVDT